MARATIQRFKIICELGSGGMGTVYRARDPRLERDVAIKVLKNAVEAAGGLSSHDTVDLRAAAPRGDDLLAEARMMAKLSHPNVVPIYEVGLDDNTMFLVMEYIEGSTLRAWLREPRTTVAILDIYEQASRGMLAAHARGIVHRDFKPDNVLIGSDGRARVADFGLANVAAPRALVRVHDNRGTLRYMAPELLLGSPASASSDVFALCVALLEAFGAARDSARDLSAATVPTTLRDLLAAGLSEQAEARPELVEIVDALAAEVSSARTAASQYEIITKLATGGMAEIFLARAASTVGVERHVVLKRVLPNFASDARFVRMFLDEARVAAQLQHPNIAQVYDSGKLDGSYFFTMEYVHGETVGAIVKQARANHRTVPISVTLAIVAGAAAGLHHAHERLGLDGMPLHIVHRDVSPSNLMVSFEGHVKLVDFGIAKATRRGEHTDTGTIKGKIAYMSPEQCRSDELDRRSDLFSLGIVMWELLAHERLFRLDSDLATMQAIVAATIAPPSSLRGEVPPDLDSIVVRLLAKDPADRFQTAGELHEAIEAAAARIGAALSVGTLGRFVRELFGDRPLPWIAATPNTPAAPEPQSPATTATLDASPTTRREPRASTSAPAVDVVAVRPRRTLRVAAIAAVAALVAGTMIAIGISGGAVATLGADAPSVAAVADGASTAALAAVTSDAPAAIADAAVAVVSPVGATPRDAAEVASAMPLDAGAAVGRPHHRPRPASHPATAASAASAARRYEDAVVTCKAAPSLVAHDAACVIAACHLGEATIARGWLALLAQSERGAARTGCEQLGIDLATPKIDDTEACKRDPMSCQY